MGAPISLAGPGGPANLYHPERSGLAAGNNKNNNEYNQLKNTFR